ncbi:MAG: DNA mismatch repair protein MutS [Treponema sp.]|jgi:DNA mismatch repair protein MutS|nr:DNA mismatch repair protein MutS [Treponema sp.]
MLEQYRRIRREHPGEVLFFRLGDFYEMFAEDALEISSLLNLTLTSRNGQPMCGIPYHAARAYIARLLRFGKKIAVCEQIAEPGKGLMERQVVEIITPGTTVDEDYLDQGSSNYLACFAGLSKFFSFAYIDLSTGDFYASAFPREGAAGRFRQELERLQVRELIVQESLLEEYPELAAAVNERSGIVVNRWADWLFDRDRSRARLEKQFGQQSLKSFAICDDSPEIAAAGALLDYLDDTAKSLIPHVRSVSVYHDSEFTGIDESTQRNLELTRNLQDGESRFTLLEVMDETRTAMGKRLLKGRILRPLRDAALIGARLDMVETLYRNQEKLSRLRELLGRTPDLERLRSRIAMDKAHGKDMTAVKNALTSYSLIHRESREFNFRYESPEAAALDSDAGALARLSALKELLEQGLAEDPSILLTEGNLIRGGFNADLDKLRLLRDSGRKMLEDYLEDERAATGISSLRIRYNRLIGYFFEVTKNHLSKVPPYFIRRQGIVAGERFTTDRLAELESEINGASDKIVELEKKLFLELREKAKSCLTELAAAGRRIAELDVAQSLARGAALRGWVRPELDGENRLRIIEGRHPVVEAHLPRGEFIPNDVILGLEENGTGPAFALITGPNMAGKSTYLRQAALTVIMAQAGSFVPAREARIGICDRIYCRVGASDNLARGESTFLVEMNETAYILNTASEKSLVIMDEVGRGTGTNDGLAIAWAVSEDLLNRVKCRTLFATHYHELSRISHPGMVNRSMEVSDQDGEIVFLRRLREGPTAKSYGLHVARMAGLPESVLARSAGILEELEADSPAAIRELKAPVSAPQYPAAGISDSTAKDAGEKVVKVAAWFMKELSEIDPNTLTPLEALTLLHEWKRRLSGKGSGTTAGLFPARKGPGKTGKDKEAPGLFDI